MNKLMYHRIKTKIGECRFLIAYKRACKQASIAIANAHWLNTPSQNTYEKILENKQY